MFRNQTMIGIKHLVPEQRSAIILADR